MRKGLAILASLLLISVGMLSQDVVIIRHPVIAAANPIATYNYVVGNHGSELGNWTWTTGFTTTAGRMLVGLLVWYTGGAQTVGYSNNATGGTDDFVTLTQQNNANIQMNTQVFCIANLKGGATTFTFTNASIQYVYAAVVELTYTGNTCTFSGSHQAMSSGDTTGSAANSVTSGAMAGTYPAGSMALGLFTYNSATSFTAGTNYALLGTAGNLPVIEKWLLASQQTDIAATGNMNINDYWHASGVVIAHQ